MKSIFLLMGLTLMSFAAYAQAPAGMPHTFAPNTPAKAAEVNANFDALLQAAQTLSTLNQQQQAQIDDLIARLNAAETALGAAETALSAAQTQIAALENAQSSSTSSITALEAFQTSATADITALQTHVVEGLGNFVEVTTDAKGYDLIRFTGVNVQLRNLASGQTNSANGLGNFIIGQNEPGFNEFCSDSSINTEHNTTISEQANCELLPHNYSGTATSAGIWASNQRSGSHNLIIGDYHDYTATGALIAGKKNISNANNASILGGESNLASGIRSVIVAGKQNNTKVGDNSFIGGGKENTASGRQSSIVGGGRNIASASSSSVFGGGGNRASGNLSSVSGGGFNNASAMNSSVAGGSNNTASGIFSSVSGGGFNNASGIRSSIGGGLSVTNSTDNKFSAKGTISP